MSIPVGYTPKIGGLPPSPPPSDRIEVERPGKAVDFSAIRNKHNSIPRRVGFALLVLATGGLAYLFKKGVSAVALLSKFDQWWDSGKLAELKNKKNQFLEIQTQIKEREVLKNFDRTLTYGIPTVDEGGGKLDAAIVFSDQEAATDFKKEKPQENEFWIVKLNANGRFYEEFMETHDQNRKAVEKELRKKDTSARVNVAMFNYRGIGESTGSADCADDLVLDGITMCQFLLDKGIPADHILLDGISMGGMAATKAYGFFNERQQRVNLVRDRTFGELRNAAEQVGINLIGEKFGAALKHVFHATNWRGNAEKVLKNKTKDWGNVLELYHVEDHIMKDSALTEAVAAHKANDNTESESIICLPLRFEAAQAGFSNGNRIPGFKETEDNRKMYQEKVEEATQKVNGNQLQLTEALEEWFVGMGEQIKKWDQLLKLYAEHDLLKTLGELSDQLKNCEEAEDFFTKLQEYGDALDAFLNTEGKGLDSETETSWTMKAKVQKNVINFCKNVMTTREMHQFNFSYTDAWKQEIIPKIAGLFDVVKKEE